MNTLFTKDEMFNSLKMHNDKLVKEMERLFTCDSSDDNKMIQDCINVVLNSIADMDRLPKH